MKTTKKFHFFAKIGEFFTDSYFPKFQILQFSEEVHTRLKEIKIEVRGDQNMEYNESSFEMQNNCIEKAIPLFRDSFNDEAKTTLLDSTNGKSEFIGENDEEGRNFKRSDTLPPVIRNGVLTTNRIGASLLMIDESTEKFTKLPFYENDAMDNPLSFIDKNSMFQ